MNYKEQIKHLQNESIQKSEAYMGAMKGKRRRAKPADAANCDKYYREWEAAEAAYTNFLISIKMQQMNIHEIMKSQA